jgi:hypothetical protein
MKVRIDVVARKMFILPATIDFNKVLWDATDLPACNVNYGLVGSLDASEIIGAAMPFDGTLDIEVVNDGRHIEFEVIGDGLK